MIWSSVEICLYGSCVSCSFCSSEGSLGCFRRCYSPLLVVDNLRLGPLSQLLVVFGGLGVVIKCRHAEK